MDYVLSITSWADRFRGSQCAEHYYGRIRFDGNEVDLEHEIELRDPRYQDCSLACMQAKPGDRRMTVRFATVEELKSVAYKWFEENAKSGDRLLLKTGVELRRKT